MFYLIWSQGTTGVAQGASRQQLLWSLVCSRRPSYTQGSTPVTLVQGCSVPTGCQGGGGGAGAGKGVLRPQPVHLLQPLTALTLVTGTVSLQRPTCMATKVTFSKEV